MSSVRQFAYPRTIEEAVELLLDPSCRSAPIAGGTGAVFSKSADVERLVDITRAGLDTLRVDGGEVVIGATMRAADLAASSLLGNGACALVAEAASRIGTPPIRNAVTLGGNLVHLLMWSDLPAAMLALDAGMVLQARERRTLHATEFFAIHPRRLLREGELLTEVRIPAPSAGTGGAFLKHTPSSGDYSVLTIAAVITEDAGTVRDARVAVSAATNLPKRLHDVEELLAGGELDDGLFERAGEMAGRAEKLLGNFKASQEYRRHLLRSLLPGVLRQATERARGARS